MSLFLPGFGQITFTQLIGMCGFFLYVLNYFLLCLGCLTSENIRFFGLNVLAASLVLISLTTEFNLASALIQVFWIAIGLWAMALRLMQRRRVKRASQAQAAQRQPVDSVLVVGR